MKLKSILHNSVYRYKPFSPEKPFKNYLKLLDKNGFTVYAPNGETVIGAYDNTVCTQSKKDKDTLYIYPDYHIVRRKYCVHLHNGSFPDLIPGSHIQHIFIVPFIKGNDGDKRKSWRLVVVTDRCQVYHNYPDGAMSDRSVTSFAESFVWDMPGNKYPSLNKKCEPYETFNPFLPDSCYEYHPGGDSPKKYKYLDSDGTQVVLSRFYFPKRNAQSNPFSYMGGYEPDPIMTLVGTYCGNHSEASSSRIVVFATTDGGVNWLAKYEFNDSGINPNYGNPISLNGRADREIFDWSDKIQLVPREWIENETTAIYPKRGAKVTVKSIQCNDVMTIVTETEHGLESGRIVALQGESKSDELNILFNNEFTDGDLGNGMFFKVEVVDSYTLRLYECMSKSRSFLPARHVHSINRIKDGWTIATGEMFPEGWLLLANMRSADNWGNVQPDEDLNFIRVNTSKGSIQRIVGAVITGNNEDELVFASDCSSIIKERREIRPDEEFIINSIGIYKGKLSDADDFSKFSLFMDVIEPSYYFKSHDDCYVFCGQRGELCFGFDKGSRWERARICKRLVHFFGRTPDFFVIDGYLLRLHC